MATGVGVSVSDFLDSGAGGQIRPQFLETIKNRFQKSIAAKEFFGLCEQVPFMKHMGNTIKRNEFDKMLPTTMPLNNSQNENGSIINKQTVSARNVEMDVWMYGAFVELSKWLILTQDGKIDPITLDYINQNAVESIEAKVREYLTLGEKVFNTATDFTFSGCPCTVHTGKSGLQTADNITSAGNGGLDLGLIRELVREVQMLNGKDVQVVMSQYAADALALTDTKWADMINSAYSGKGRTASNPLQSAAFDVPYMNCNFKIMQDSITEDISEDSTPCVVDNIFIIPKNSIIVPNTASNYTINTVGFDAKNINDPYNFVKSISWQTIMGAKVIDNSVVYKLQTYYTGGPAAPTVFDQLNAEEL